MSRVAEREHTVTFRRPDLAAAWGFRSAEPTTLEVIPDEVDLAPAAAAPESVPPIGARAGRVAGLPLLGYYLPALKGNVWATVSLVLAGLAVAAGLVVHEVLLAVVCGLMGSVAGGLGQALVTRDPHRAGNFSIAVGLGISIAVTLVGATILGVVFAGPAAGPPSPATAESTPAPDYSVVQSRCSGVDGIGYFVGSFTNRTTATVSYRVEVDFLGRDGAPVGQQSQRVAFVGPRATSPLDLRTSVKGDVAVCRTTATELPRSG